MTTTAYTVEGMTCQHCVNAVTTEVGRLPGVSEVAVDLGAQRVTVSSETPLAEPELRAAIDEAGYTLVGVAS
jgi:copper ion binding protein